MTRKKARKPQRRNMKRSQTSARALCVAGMATTATAGALMMIITAPQAAADTSNPLQPTIDQILAQMQQAVASDSALPFATPDSNAQLPTIMQNTEFQLLQLMLAVKMGASHGIWYTTPETVAGDAADPRQYFGFFNADTLYPVVALDPHATYEVIGTVGKGTGDLVFTLNSASFGSAVPGPSLQLDHGLVVNPDGTFTIDIGPTEPVGASNYLDDTGETTLVMRDKLADIALGPSSLNVECVADCPASAGTTTGLSTADINSLLTALANYTAVFNNFNIVQEAEVAGIQLPANTMSPFAHEDVGGGFPGQFLSLGHFDLQPDQALIVKVPEIPAGYQSIQLNNVFGATLPGTLAQTSLNNTQAFHDPDGYTYYVVSATNPGVANWLDSGSITEGSMIARYENFPDGTDPAGLPVTTQVVPITDVSHYLPADTPTVSPAEYAADMTQRVLSLDYALDVSRQDNWVMQEVLLHDLQAAMGTTNFDAVFGAEPATPMWLRLTPALSPDWLTVAKDVLTDPSASLTAIQDNLALAGKDIALPAELAGALLLQDVSQTSQAVQADLSSGQLMQALTALANGGQQFGSILNDALTDPNTSITAGILNARDDLATAIMAATNGFPSDAGPLATLEWEHMSHVADLSTLLNPADFFTA